MQEKYERDIPKHILDKLNDKKWMYDEHVVQEKQLSQISRELNVSYDMVERYLHSHGIQNFMFSMDEKELGDYIESLGVEVIRNDKTIINPLELDIVIPSQKLAIEYCGLYWHTEFKGKSSIYHKYKLDRCNENGYRLITLFENEWLNKKELIKKKIKHIIFKTKDRPIYARKTHVKLVNSNIKNDFMNQHHIQGKGLGSISLGLYFENELVSLVTFVNNKNNYVLNRFASSKQVVGGFSKLLKYFINNYPKKEIITFADLRWSEGKLYEKTGFKLDKELEPDYYYIYNGELRHKFGFRRKALAKMLPNFDPTLTEYENCINHEIYRIWTCGLKRFTYTV